MIEHRLIEKMLMLADQELVLIKKNNRVNPVVIDTFVDFIRTYADRTHHGKEEDILFKALESKKLKSDDKNMMSDLVNEHINARKVVGRLVEAKNNYVNTNAASLDTVIETLSYLIDFYPRHIEKEDEVFFPNSEKYFSNTELEVMLHDFWEFDRKMIHEKYNKLYAMLKNIYT